MSKSKLLLFILVLFSLLHNLEEYYAINYLEAGYGLQNINMLSPQQFNYSVLIISILIVIVLAFALLSSNPLTLRFIGTSLGISLLINAFIPHITIAMYTHSYTPGLLTSILLIVPASLVLLLDFRKKYDTKRQLWMGYFYGILAGYLLFLGTVSLVKALI